MAVSGNTPASLDLNVRQGSDLALTVAVQLDAVDYDFTGATVTAKVLDGSGREQTSVTWATTTATGELVLALSAAETALIRSGWRWYVDVTKASLTQPWLAGALIPVAPGFAGPTSTTVSLSLATGDGHALSISADPGQGLAAHVAAADPHPGYVLESVLTTAGDLLTRGASAPDRVTRASLAQDTAFSSRYAPLYPTVATVSGTTDTLTAADHGTTIRYTNASLVTVTLPTDVSEDLSDGFWCSLVSEGAAGLTLSTSGLTLGGSSPNKSIAQNEVLVVMKTPAANTWLILGGTSA